MARFGGRLGARAAPRMREVEEALLEVLGIDLGAW